MFCVFDDCAGKEVEGCSSECALRALNIGFPLLCGFDVIEDNLLTGLTFFASNDGLANAAFTFGGWTLVTRKK